MPTRLPALCQANAACEPAHIVNVFTASNYTRVTLAPTVAALGQGVATEMFGLQASIEVQPAPLIAPLAGPECQAACKA